MVAHSGGAPEFATTILFGGGVALAWIGVSRLRRRGFSSLPRWIGVAMLAFAPVAVVGSLLLPSLLWPNPVATGPRPASSASIAFAEPAPGQVVTGEELRVWVRVENGTIVEGSSTNITRDTGHLHLFLDGELLSMTTGGEQRMDIGELTSGEHELRAEFVAADHAPFDPPVVAAVTFVKETP
jgi:branched-subunit amino acid transport protein